MPSSTIHDVDGSHLLLFALLSHVGQGGFPFESVVVEDAVVAEVVVGAVVVAATCEDELVEVEASVVVEEVLVDGVVEVGSVEELELTSLDVEVEDSVVLGSVVGSLVGTGGVGIGVVMLDEASEVVEISKCGSSVLAVDVDVESTSVVPELLREVDVSTSEAVLSEFVVEDVLDAEVAKALASEVTVLRLDIAEAWPLEVAVEVANVLLPDEALTVLIFALVRGVIAVAEALSDPELGFDARDIDRQLASGGPEDESIPPVTGKNPWIVGNDGISPKLTTISVTQQDTTDKSGP